MKFHLCLEILVSTIAVINGRQIQESLKSGAFEETARTWYECVWRWEWRWDECLPWYVTVPVGLSGSVPESRETINTQFWFYTPDRINDAQTISNPEIKSWDVKKSGFNPSAKTVFITHGFQGGNAEWAQRMKSALIQKEKCNVFVVDWTDGAANPVYEQAAANIRVVGSEIAFLIHYLNNATGLRLQDVHLIGHSLGAHASGFAAKAIYSASKQKVGRISGLDPAGPMFDGEAPEDRLDLGDATFVDAIHTNWGENRLEGFGSIQPLGHFDFYPNGGEDQPGCKTTSQATEGVAETLWDKLKWSILPIPFGHIVTIYKAIAEDSPAEIAQSVEDLSCSHGRAYEFYLASISVQTCKFQSLECPSWENYTAGKCGSCKDHKCVSMGYYADKYKDMVSDKPRKFYLKTTSDFPYCMDDN